MNKITTTLTLSAALLLTNACGVSPSGPSDLPAGVSQAPAATAPTSANTAQTSGKGRQILPPAACATATPLDLWIGSRAKGFVEVASNYLVADRACPGLSWVIDSDVAQLSSETFVTPKGEGLRLFTNDTGLSSVVVFATAPDGQIAKIQVEFSIQPPSDDTPAATASTASKTPRSRQILPPACATGNVLDLAIVTREKGIVDVISNYRQTDRACAGLAWEIAPTVGFKELSPETFAAPKGEGLRLFTRGSTLRGVSVIATAPDGQVAKVNVDFREAPASDDTL